MRVHILRHAAFEGPGLITEWAAEHSHQLSESYAFTEEYPDASEVDLLVVLGGPMSATDDANNPWLEAERAYIRQVVDGEKLVFAICLGAQLLAQAMGGSARRNRYPEIGWYPVRVQAEAQSDAVFSCLPEVFVPGHWHSDTFDLPDGTETMISSDATANQAFSLADGRAVGLQFHLEWTEADLEALIESCGSELTGAQSYVMTKAEFISHGRAHISACRTILWDLLEARTSRARRGETA